MDDESVLAALRAGGGPHTPGLRPDVRVPHGWLRCREWVISNAPRDRRGAGLRESAHALRRARCFTASYVGRASRILRSGALRPAPRRTRGANMSSPNSKTSAATAAWRARASHAFGAVGAGAGAGERCAAVSSGCSSAGKLCCTALSSTSSPPASGSSWKWTARITRASAVLTSAGTARSRQQASPCCGAGRARPSQLARRPSAGRGGARDVAAVRRMAAAFRPKSDRPRRGGRHSEITQLCLSEIERAFRRREGLRDGLCAGSMRPDA